MVIRERNGRQHGQPQVRVLAVIPGDGTGASMIFARREVAAVEGAGPKVKTFFLHSRTSPVAVCSEWARLRREIREFMPHVIHAHYGTVTGFLCAYSTNLPVLITYRGSDLNRTSSVSRMRSQLSHIFSQFALLRARKAVCVSNELRNKLWWRRKKVIVAPSGVNIDLFQPRPKNVAREQLGWPVDAPIVLFNAGGAPGPKGLKLVERAIAHVRDRIRDVQLVTMDGTVSPDVVPLYFSAADCLVLASESEGSPTVVQEAIASNLPVVSVDVGDVRERLQGIFPSRIVARDPVDLGNGVVEVLALKSRSNGRSFVGPTSLETVARTIAAIYEELAQC